MKWRIYYGDGSTFDDSQGTPQEAPPLNIQIIVVADPDVGRQLLHLWDWYYWDGEQWAGADIYGLLDQLMWNGVTAIKQGRTLPEKQFNEIKKRAVEDTAFPVKSGKKKTEGRRGQAWGEGKDA